MIVSDIMKTPVCTEKDITVREAAKIMSEKQIGSLIITSKGKIAGILTENDILNNIDNLSGKISKIMTKEVVVIDSESTVENAAKVMSEKKIKRLPVLKKNELVGIITATNILAYSKDIDEDFFFD